MVHQHKTEKLQVLIGFWDHGCLAITTAPKHQNKCSLTTGKSTIYEQLTTDTLKFRKIPSPTFTFRSYLDQDQKNNST